MTNSKKEPIAKLRDGSLEIAIWANETEKGIRYATDGVIRSYLDASGNWQQSQSLSSGEIPRASWLLQKAYDRISDLKAAEKSKAANQS